MFIAALALLSLAAPQDAVAVLQTGDVLTGGLTVSSIYSQAVSNTGSWVAVANTTDASSTSGTVIVQDGLVLMREGDTLLTGERVRYIVTADISPTGTVATAVTVYDASGTTGSIGKLAIDGRVVLSRGDALVGPNVPAGAEVLQINDVRHRGAITLISGTIRDNAQGERDALLLFQGIGSVTRTVDILALEGAPTPGLSAPFTSLNSRMALASDGTAAAPVRIGTFSNGTTAVVTDQGGIMEEGMPGPFPGSTWSAYQGPTVAAATGGRYAFCAHVLEAGGTATDVLMVDGAILAQLGQPHPAYPANPIVNLGEVPLERSSAGEVFYTSLVSGVGRVLAVDDEPLLVQNTSQASGIPIMSLGGATNSLAISDSGDYVLIQAGLANGQLALALVERSVGVATGCAVTANSTGAPSALRGDGSAFASENRLVLEATDLPRFSFGYLNTSPSSGFVANPAGSAGNLCLGGSVGRFIDQVGQSGSSGTITTVVDTTRIPQPLGAAAAQPGATWYFQLWHRDSSSSGPTSNFSSSLAVTFR
ncbi:hypothetical protein Poly30_49250 [Planctomycetes bacterium Poly30]|uniref:Uncharacterized protein n=1 Tax=Saltatorellus ferox TaxID=2528018 RepID=A0A518EZ58_9BACT|nr:hypothetical protein Poly30_49250 [Planctomycetes bacterium Poly30]